MQVPIGQTIPRDSIQFKTDHSGAGIMNLRNKMNNFVNSTPEPSTGPTMPGSLQKNKRWDLNAATPEMN